MRPAVFLALIFAVVPFASAAVPVMNTSGIAPDSPSTQYDLDGYCKANDTDSPTVYFEYKWYLNGALNSSANHSASAYLPNQDWYSSTGAWRQVVDGSLTDGVSNVFDDDWGTSAYPKNTDESVYAYPTYNLTPYQPVVNATWTVKWYATPARTVTVPSQCLFHESINLSFRIHAYRTGGNGHGYAHWECDKGSWDKVAGSSFETYFSENYRTYIQEESVNLSYREPESQASLLKLSTISHDSPAKNENWTFSCRAFDGTNYSEWLNSSSVTVENSLPEPYARYFLPVVPQNDYNLTVNYSVSDADNDSVTEENIRWFKDGTRVAALNNASIVLAGNTSLGEEWYYEINIFDGENWSYQYWQSYKTVIGDDVAPIVQDEDLSTTSGVNDQPFTIYADVVETNQIAEVKVEVIDPNSQRSNYTMSLAVNETVKTYTRTYYPGTDGVYTFVFYTKDGSGNTARLESALEYRESTQTGGSSGGGGSTGPDAEEIESIIESTTKGYVLFASPGIPIKVQPPPRSDTFEREVVITAKDGPVMATLDLSDNIEPFFDAELCDIYTLECADEALIKEGEQKYVKISGDLSSRDFQDAFEASGGNIEGYLRVLSSGDPGDYAYKITVEKAWLYDASLDIAQQTGLTHKQAHGFMWGGIFLIPLILGAIAFFI